MPIFDYRFTVPASQQIVRDFHHDTSVLAILTPPPTIMRVHSMEPLGEGSVSRFTIWAGPIPLRWEATHRNVTEAGFTDVQTDGPMARWEHTHTFRPLNLETTEVQEHIEYQHAGGFWGVVTRVFFAPPALKALFAYRRFQTVRHCKRRRLQTDS